MTHLLESMIARLTRRIWNNRFKAVVSKLYEDGKIDSFQMHLICGEWDRRFYPKKRKI